VNYTWSVPTANSAKARRKRCLNCNKYFVPRPNVGARAKFCTKDCCDEFHRHGSAFGPMKTGLYRAIDKKYAALEKQMSAKLRTFALAVQVLTDDIMSLRKLALHTDAIAARLLSDYSNHTHCQTGMPRDDSGADDYTLIPRDVEESQRKAAVERTLSGRRSR
jgi:hypothetical protein